MLTVYTLWKWCCVIWFSYTATEKHNECHEISFLSSRKCKSSCKLLLLVNVNILLNENFKSHQVPILSMSCLLTGTDHITMEMTFILKLLYGCIGTEEGTEVWKSDFSKPVWNLTCLCRAAVKHAKQSSMETLSSPLFLTTFLLSQQEILKC